MYDAYLLVLLALKEVVTHTQTDRRTDGQTDICLSKAAFAAENWSYDEISKWRLPLVVGCAAQYKYKVCKVALLAFRLIVCKSDIGIFSNNVSFTLPTSAPLSNKKGMNI